MTRIAAAVLLPILLAAAGCHHGAAPAPAPPPAPATPADVTRAVTSRVEQYRQAMEVRSLDALSGLYSQTAELEVTRQGTPLRGWPAVKEDLAGFCTSNSQVKVRLTNLKVIALGEGGALANASLHRTYGDGVRLIDEDGTLTLVFRREGDTYRIVAEHFSYLISP